MWAAKPECENTCRINTLVSLGKRKKKKQGKKAGGLTYHNKKSIQENVNADWMLDDIKESLWNFHVVVLVLL